MADFAGMMVPVGADDAALRRGLAAAEQRVDQFTNRVDSSLRRVDGAFDRLSATAGRLGGALAGLVTAQTASVIVAQADAWNLAGSKIALYTGSAAQAAVVQEQLFQVAQRSRAALEPTVGLYASLADAMLGMGKSQGDVLRVTETVSKTFKISGTEAGAAAGALTQLSQAMASGVLRGDEFNSVMEASPRLAKALADGLGVPRGALKQLAEQGALTAEKVVGALTKQAGAVDAEFGRLSVTVGDSLTALGNAAQRQIGRLDQTTGATATLAHGALTLADNLDTVGTVAAQAALALGAIGAARVMPAGLQALTRAIDDVKVALYAKAVATMEAANAEKLAAAQGLIATQQKRAAAAAAVTAAEAEIFGKVAAASTAAANLTAAENALTLAKAKGALTNNVYVVNRALAAERDAQAAVTVAREASIAADGEKSAALGRLRAAQVAAAASGDAVAAATLRATAAAEGAQAASVALAQRASLLAAAWGGLRMAGAAMLGMVGGPLGAALLAGAGAAYLYASRTTEAEAATQAFGAATQAAQDAVKDSASDVEALAQQYAGLSDAMRAVARIKLEDALAKQAEAVVAQRRAAAAAVYSPTESPLRIVESNHGSDNLPEVAAYERMGLAAKQVDALRVAFAAFRDAAADDPQAISALVRVLDNIGRSAGAAGQPLLDLARQLADPATKAEDAAKAAQQLQARLALMANPADQAAKAVLQAGQSATLAASNFTQMGGAVGGAAAKLAELATKAKLFELPAGFERKVAEIAGLAPEPKTPVVTGAQDRRSSDDDTAYQRHTATTGLVRTAAARVSTAEVADQTAELARQAAGQRLLAGAVTDAAKAQAQNRIELAKAALEYPELGAETAKTLLTTTNFGAALQALPSKLQDRWVQLQAVSQAQLAGAVTQGTVQLQLQAEAQQRLADAAGQGEAAQRQAAIQNAVAAAALKGLGAATRQYLDDQEAATVQQIRAEQTQPILDRIRAQTALVAAYKQSPEAVRAAEIAEQAHTAALREGAQGTDAYTDAKARYVALLTKAAKLDSAAAAGPLLQQQRDQLTLGRQQLALINATAEQRAVELARTQALIDLRGKNIDAASEEGRAYLANAEALARQTLEIERTNAAYQELEQFGEKAFSAVVDAAVAGGKATDTWKNAVKGLASEFQTLALKMTVVNGAKNALLGTNLPTLFDLGGGGGGAAASQAVTIAGQAYVPAQGQSQGGASGGIGASSLLNGSYGLSSLSGGWLDRQLNGGITSVSNALASPAYTIGGSSLPSAASMEGIDSVGQLGAVEGTAVSWGQAAGGAFSVASGLYNFTKGNYVSGAGQTIGGALTLMGMPEIGIPIAIVSTLLEGLFGKDRGKPAAAAGAVFRDGRVVQSGADTDNEGSPEQAKQLLDSLTAATRQFITIAGNGKTKTDFGIGVEAKDGKYRARIDNELAGSYDTLDEAVIASFKHNIAGGLIDASQEVIQAVARSTQTDINEFMKDVSLARSIHDATAGLVDLDQSLSGIAARAKKTAADQYATVDDSVTRADSLGLGDQLRAVLASQIRSTFVAAGQSFTAVEIAEAQAAAATDALVEAAKRWGLSVSEAEIRADAAAKAEQRRGAVLADYQAQLLTAQGRGYLTSLAEVANSRETVRRNLAAVGVGDAAGKADTLIGAQVSAALSGLNLAQLADVTRTLGGAVGALAETLRQATQAAATEDLTVRRLRAQGRTAEADTLELSLRQRREYDQAVKDGYDDTYLAQLRLVQGLEAVQAAADGATAAVTKVATAAEALAKSQDLTVRRLRATGQTAEADALERSLKSQREIAQAVADGFDAATVAELRLTLALEDQRAAADAAATAMAGLTGTLAGAAQSVLDAHRSLAIAPVSVEARALQSLGGVVTGPRIAMLQAGLDPGERPGLTGDLLAFNATVSAGAMTADGLGAIVTRIRTAFNNGKLSADQYGAMVDYVTNRFNAGQQALQQAAETAAANANTKRQGLLGVREALGGGQRQFGQRLLDVGLDPTVYSGLTRDMDALIGKARAGTGTADDYAAAALRLSTAFDNGRLTGDQFQSLLADVGKEFEAVTAKSAQTVGALRQLQTGLTNYLVDMRVGERSALAPDQQRSEAWTALTSAITAAQAGDENAMGRITGLSDAFLTASRAVYATGSGYATDYASVQSALTTVRDNIADGKTPAQVTASASSLSATRLGELNTAIATARDAQITAIGKVTAAQKLTTDAQTTMTGILSGSVTNALDRLAATTDNPISAPIVAAVGALRTDSLAALALIAANGNAKPSALQNAITATDAQLASQYGGSADTPLTLANGATISQARRNALARELGYGGGFGSGLLQAYMDANPAWAQQFLAAAALAASPSRALLAPVLGAHRLGGLVGAYRSGGLVGNGQYDVDSVRARYAGGGDILLAGNEFVTRAPAVNALTRPMLEHINRTGSLPAVANGVRFQAPDPLPARDSVEGAAWQAVAAAIAGLGDRLDHLAARIDAVAAAHQRQRARGLADLASGLTAIKAELDDLPRRIADAA